MTVTIGLGYILLSMPLLELVFTSGSNPVYLVIIIAF